MTIIKQLLPVCDFCGESFPDMIISEITVKKMRESLKMSGWSRVNGKDMCFLCPGKEEEKA